MTTPMSDVKRGDSANESDASDPSGAERRQSTRVLVDLEVDCLIEDNYLFTTVTDISATGIFVRTTSPEPPGTLIRLRLGGAATSLAANTNGAIGPIGDVLASGSTSGRTDQLAIEGEVAWINPYRPGQLENLHPGMGVRFIGLSAEDQARLMQLIRRIAYLPEDLIPDDLG